jgi:hypothetical protein
MRFTFDGAVTPHIVVQATRSGISGEIFIDTNKREISGWNPERQDSVLGPFTADDFKGYFVARFDTSCAEFGTAHAAVLSGGLTHDSGDELSAYCQFAPGIKSVNVRVGVSYISIDQARRNLDSETPDSMSLEQIAEKVEQQWAEKLDLVTLTNATDADNAIFYTAMYHALQVLQKMRCMIEVFVYVCIYYYYQSGCSFCPAIFLQFLLI